MLFSQTSGVLVQKSYLYSCLCKTTNEFSVLPCYGFLKFNFSLPFFPLMHSIPEATLACKDLDGCPVLLEFHWEKCRKDGVQQWKELPKIFDTFSF